MATITPTVSEPGSNVKLVQWNQINADDVGGAVQVLPHYKHKTIHVRGTFDTGTYTLEGSMDNATWFECHSLGGTIAAGDPLDFTAAGVAIVAENALFYRIAQTGGTTEDVDIDMMCVA